MKSFSVSKCVETGEWIIKGDTILIADYHKTITEDLEKLKVDSNDVIIRMVQEPQWRDISTAPKDGRRVLLYFSRSGGEWKETVGRFQNDGGFWYKMGSNFDLLEPSHWAEIPEPPQGER